MARSFTKRHGAPYVIIDGCIECGICERVCPYDAIFMSDELELADFTRGALVYDMEKLKRPRAALAARIDYVYRINDRWRKPSST